MFHGLYPTSEQSKVIPAAPYPGVGATEATFPFGTARRDLSHKPAVDCVQQLCSLVLDRGKRKKEQIKAKQIHSTFPTQVCK